MILQAKLRAVCARVLVALFMLASTGKSLADVRTDGSLTGLAQTVPGSAMVDYLISEDFGARSGDNLFFSFEEFSIDVGEIAEFQANPIPTSNIFARVSGGAVSQINGDLRSSVSGANLWLINPQGWTFGGDALIDVPATLNVISGESIAFDNNERFGLETPVEGLSSSQPMSIQIGGSSGDIVVERLVLNVGVEGLGLYADDVSVESLFAGTLFAPRQAQIEIIAAGENSTVFVRPDGNESIAAAATGTGDLSLEGSNITLSGDGGTQLRLASTGVTSVQDTSVLAFGNGSAAGRVLIRGGQIVVGSDVDIGTAVPTFQAGTRAPDIELIATEAIEFSGSLRAAATANGSTSGEVTFSAPQIELVEASISSSRATLGNSGSLNFNASESLLVSGGSIENVTTAGVGAITNFNGGQVTFDNAFVQADGQDTEVGPGIRVDADDVALLNNTTFTADVERGAGQGIELVASDSLLIDSSLVTTESFDDAIGAPLVVTAQQIQIVNGGRLTSDVVLAGAGGSIDITAGSLVIEGGEAETGIFARSGSFSLNAERLDLFVDDPNFATGDGGDVLIRVDDFELLGGQVVVDTFGLGAAGSINLTVDGRALISNGGLVSGSSTLQFEEIGPGMLGSGGNVTIVADELLLDQGSRIVTNTDSNLFSGGSVDITARQIELRGDPATAAAAISSLDLGVVPDASFTGIVSNSSGSAQGGSLTLLAESVDSNAAVVSASASGLGGGGSVVLGAATAPIQTLLFDSQSGLLARAQQGNGGAVSVFTDAFLRDANSVISADSEAAAGTVDIIAPELNVTSALVDLDSSVLDATSLLADPCGQQQNNNSASASSLVVRGRGGLAASPTDYLPVVTHSSSPAVSDSLAGGCSGVTR